MDHVSTEGKFGAPGLPSAAFCTNQTTHCLTTASSRGYDTASMVYDMVRAPSRHSALV